MIIKKIIETFLDISDPKEIFAPNRDEIILEKLRAKFVGICFMSCLIMSVNRIIRRSYVYMKDTLDGDALTNIQFEVDAIIYFDGEIINGVTIVKKEPNGIIHAKSKYAGIQLSIQPNMTIFKEGDIVPVIVKRVRYNVNQNAASILAVPFMPSVYTPIYYNILGELSKIQIDELRYLITQIEIEETKIKNLNAADKKIFQFFIDLLNPISAKKSDKKDSKNIKLINTKNILDIKNGIIFNADNKFDETSISYMAKSSDMVSELSQINSGTKQTLEIVDESIYIAIYSLLCQRLMNIQSLQSFLQFYPDFASVQKNKDIWKMYTMLKK
jgi:hypothetical protein